MRLEELLDDLFHVEFDTKFQMNSTFLRIAEHGSSIEFEGKIFRLKEFREWYIHNSPEGKKTGKFTYYGDYDGHFIPSVWLEPFYEGKFDPLYKRERDVLEKFEDKKKKEYNIIATYPGKKQDNILMHEFSHLLFDTNSDYKEEIIEALSEISTKDRIGIANCLVRLGYQYPNLDGETQAILCEKEYLDFFKGRIASVTPGIAKAHEKINAIFIRFLPEKLRQRLKLH